MNPQNEMRLAVMQAMAQLGQLTPERFKRYEAMQQRRARNPTGGATPTGLPPGSVLGTRAASVLQNNQIRRQQTQNLAALAGK